MALFSVAERICFKYGLLNWFRSIRKSHPQHNQSNTVNKKLNFSYNLRDKQNQVCHSTTFVLAHMHINFNVNKSLRKNCLPFNLKQIIVHTSVHINTIADILILFCKKNLTNGFIVTCIRHQSSAYIHKTLYEKFTFSVQ